MRTKLAAMRALWWKELREARWAWYAGAVVFVVWPLLAVVWNYHEMARRMNGWIEPDLSTPAFIFGGLFALLLAVMQVSGDVVADGVEPWRGMPLRAGTLVRVKFVVGLCVLVSVLGGAVALERWLSWLTPNPYRIEPVKSLISGSALSLWMLGATQVSVQVAVYAVTFALACWTRRAMPAVFLGAAAGLLLYFLPTLMPALGWMSPFSEFRGSAVSILSSASDAQYLNDGQRVLWRLFGRLYAIRVQPVWQVLGEGLVIAAALGWAVVVTGRRWQLRVGATQLAWTFAAAGLGLFSIAAVQVGNNLGVQRVEPLTGSKWIVFEVVQEGDQGVALSYSGDYPAGTMMVHRLDLSSSRPLGPGFGVGCGRVSTPDYCQRVAWSAGRPELVYVVSAVGVETNEHEWLLRGAELVVLRFTDGGSTDLVERIDVGELLAESLQRWSDPPSVYLVGGELWVVYEAKKYRASNETRVLRFDLSDPAHPARIDRHDLKDVYVPRMNVTEDDRLRVSRQLNTELLDGLDAGALERVLDAMSARRERVMAQGERVVTFERKRGVLVFERDDRVKSLEPTYRLVDALRPTPLERLIDAYPAAWREHEGYLYVLINSPQSGVVVYDVRAGEPVRKVGYYYAPGESLRAITVLEDGSVALVGRRLHVLARVGG